MKRFIKYIIVHSTATFDPKVSQHYGFFHYVVERNGEIKKIHPESSIIKHLPDVDNEAIHIAYTGGRNKAGALGDTRTPSQEEALFNKLVALTVKYPSAAIIGHNDLDATANCPGFTVKEWLKNYEPDLLLRHNQRLLTHSHFPFLIRVLMKRDIHYIVVHCTATPPDTAIESIKRYWKEQLHWKNPGYHYIIQRSGKIETLLLEDQIANGVKGYNKNAVHISYIGGVDAKGNPLDNRTPAQVQSMINKLTELKHKYPNAMILGHRDFPGVTKKCPSFDVREWLKVYLPGFVKVA